MSPLSQKHASIPAAKYVVYDPPAEGLPYVAVLFLPEKRPRAFLFESAEDAETFLTSNATRLDYASEKAADTKS